MIEVRGIVPDLEVGIEDGRTCWLDCAMLHYLIMYYVDTGMF